METQIVNPEISYSRNRKCSHLGCHEKHYAHGFCNTHYARWRHHGSSILPKRIKEIEKPCTIEGCNNLRFAKGLCSPHYNRRYKYGRLTTLTLWDRFWSNVEKTDGCWIWKGNKNKDGYGNIGNGPRSSYKLLLAHRISWEIHKGQIPDNLLVCHHCDNPPCVNPDHLFIGTYQDNENDKIKKGRQAKGDRNGNSKYARSRRFNLITTDTKSTHQSGSCRS